MDLRLTMVVMLELRGSFKYMMIMKILSFKFFKAVLALSSHAFKHPQASYTS